MVNAYYSVIYLTLVGILEVPVMFFKYSGGALGPFGDLFSGKVLFLETFFILIVLTMLSLFVLLFVQVVRKLAEIYWARY